jgi:hypothetical protein
MIFCVARPDDRGALMPQSAEHNYKNVLQGLMDTGYVEWGAARIIETPGGAGSPEAAHKMIPAFRRGLTGGRIC